MDESEEYWLERQEMGYYRDKYGGNQEERGSSEPIKIRCFIVEQRDKAILVSRLSKERNPEPNDITWLPKSQLEHISKDTPLDNGWIPATITMPLWLAEEKKLK